MLNEIIFQIKKLLYKFFNFFHKVSNDNIKYPIPELSEQIIPLLENFDILLSRNDKFMINRFIQGWWNHAGIFLDEYVVDAYGHGVGKKKCIEFLQTDHIVILRPNFKYEPEIVMKRINEMMGKEYDFNFELDDKRRIYCTELIYHAFEGYDHKMQISDYSYWIAPKKGLMPDGIFAGNFKVVYDSRYGTFVRKE